MAAGSIFAGFPMLVIEENDIYGSWKKWSAEFKLALGLKGLEMGFDTITVTDTSVDPPAVSTRQQPRFCEQSKLWTLLRCIGQESREAVSTLGLDLGSDTLSYNDVWAKLKDHYERDESEYVKVDKFVSCRQVSAESDRDYLLRCERLGRRCDWSAGDVRQRFTLSIAVRGLRDNVLKRELMANERLDWASLNKTLRARTCAQESLSALGDGVYPARVSNSASKSDTSTSRAAGGQCLPLLLLNLSLALSKLL